MSSPLAGWFTCLHFKSLYFELFALCCPHIVNITIVAMHISPKIVNSHSSYWTIAFLVFLAMRTRPTLSQFQCLEIRRSINFVCFGTADWRITKYQNCERVGRVEVVGVESCTHEQQLNRFWDLSLSLSLSQRIKSKFTPNLSLWVSQIEIERERQIGHGCRYLPPSFMDRGLRNYSRY